MYILYYNCHKNIYNYKYNYKWHKKLIAFIFLNLKKIHLENRAVGTGGGGGGGWSPPNNFSGFII